MYLKYRFLPKLRGHAEIIVWKTDCMKVTFPNTGKSHTVILLELYLLTGQTTICKDNAAYCIKTRMKHALYWLAERKDSQRTRAAICTDSMSLLQKVKKGEPSIQSRCTSCSGSVLGKQDGCSVMDAQVRKN